MKDFLKRYQEYIWWTPLLAALSIVAWIVFGALDARLGTDSLSFLLELPIRTAYAVAALGIAYLARHRQRRKLTTDEQSALWLALTKGERGAVIIYLTDALVWALAFTLCMFFFWPAR